MGFRCIFGLKARDNDLHYAAVSTTAKLSTHSRLLSKVIHISRLQRTPFPSKYDSFVSNCRKSVHSVARKLRSIGDVSLIRDEVWTTHQSSFDNDISSHKLVAKCLFQGGGVGVAYSNCKGRGFVIRKEEAKLENL